MNISKYGEETTGRNSESVRDSFVEQVAAPSAWGGLGCRWVEQILSFPLKGDLVVLQHPHPVTPCAVRGSAVSVRCTAMGINVGGQGETRHFLKVSRKERAHFLEGKGMCWLKLDG